MNNAGDSQPKKWRLPWAFVPVALLSSSALGVGSMAVVAVRDPSFATEENYYQKAIHWDQTQAQAGENQRLGFRVVAPASLLLDAQGHARLELTLQDRLGQPIRGASVTAQAFANAYSAELHRVTFQETAAGVYASAVDAQHAGLWVFRVTAQTPAARFTADSRLVLIAGGAA
ncbi:MAG: FixH family protein [Polyangiaceae bacterium]